MKNILTELLGALAGKDWVGIENILGGHLGEEASDKIAQIKVSMTQPVEKPKERQVNSKA